MIEQVSENQDKVQMDKYGYFFFICSGQVEVVQASIISNCGYLVVKQDLFVLHNALLQ